MLRTIFYFLIIGALAALGAWLADQTVVIAGDKIASVGPALQPPAGVEVIDLGGKALLPGLWDMHAHLGPADGALDIASGVTTARDVGNKADQLDDFKRRYDDGSAVGPHARLPPSGSCAEA